jgi:hypothetical protein
MSTFSATEERKMEALSPAALDVLRAQLREISPGQEVDGTRRPRRQYPPPVDRGQELSHFRGQS